MKLKKIVFIFIIVLSVIFDFYIGFLAFGDYLFSGKTIKVKSQNEEIVKEIKEHFKIDYNISKITYYQTFPDGYKIDIYDDKDEKQEIMEDDYKYTKIEDYFYKVKRDISNTVYILVLSILVEGIVIIIYKWKLLR